MFYRKHWRVATQELGAARSFKLRPLELLSPHQVALPFPRTTTITCGPLLPVPLLSARPPSTIVSAMSKSRSKLTTSSTKHKRRSRTPQSPAAKRPLSKCGRERERRLKTPPEVSDVDDDDERSGSEDDNEESSSGGQKSFTSKLVDALSTSCRKARYVPIMPYICLLAHVSSSSLKTLERFTEPSRCFARCMNPWHAAHEVLQAGMDEVDKREGVDPSDLALADR